MTAKRMLLYLSGFVLVSRTDTWDEPIAKVQESMLELICSTIGMVFLAGDSRTMVMEVAIR